MKQNNNLTVVTNSFNNSSMVIKSPNLAVRRKPHEPLSIYNKRKNTIYFKAYDVQWNNFPIYA